MKAFVLLSGGVDSTTCLYYAVKKHGAENTFAYGIDYGQVHNIEREYAVESCQKLGVPYKVLKLGDQPASALTDAEKNKQIPDKSYAELDAGVSPSYHWNRNMQMLALIAAHAHAEVGMFKGSGEIPEDLMGIIYAGQHADDAARSAYPDCSPPFLGATNCAIWIACYQQIRMQNPLMDMTKAEVVELGDKLGVDWSLTYSCYHGSQYHCGKCPTCLSRKEAFVLARPYISDESLRDPTVYQEQVDKYKQQVPDDDIPF